MKYAVWFVRLVFGAWMVPAGLNHFYPLFPQPMGSQPLSHELIAGISVLTGIYTPLALVMCMPVSFCVFWWDAPLEGGGAALFGEAVLVCNTLLCLAHIKSYRAMFTLLAKPRAFGAPSSPGDASSATQPAGA